MNRYSGYCSISRRTVEKLLWTFSRVWARVHSHATSMWVWPTQWTSGASLPQSFWTNSSRRQVRAASTLS